MPDATISRGPATLVGLSSVYSAAVAYITLLIAARTLSPADNAIFLVYWAVLFGAFGIVTGVSTEAARATYSAPTGGSGASVLGVGLTFGAIVSCTIAATAPLWAPRVLHDHAGLSAVAALACATYAGHLAIWGVVTGQRRWRAVAGLVIGESTARLVLVCLAFLLYDSLDTLAAAASVPALVWVAALALPVFRQAARQGADVTGVLLLRNFGAASLASSASALIMVGFPVLIAATSTAEELAGAAGLMLGISLTRAPLLVPLTALQGVALTHFLRSRRRGWLALWGVVWPVLGITLVGSILAFSIGPWIFRSLLGAGYELGGRTLAGLTASAGLLAILTLTGMFALALHRHAVFAAGWVTATVVSVSLLLLPLALTDRVLISLVVGPLVGVTVHAAGLGRARRSGDPSPASWAAPEPGAHRNDDRTERQ